MKSVIILGTGPSFNQCDYSCETWGVNGAYTAANYAKDKFRLDKLFITDHLFRPDGTFCFDIDHINELIEKYNTQIISVHRLKLGNLEIRASRYPYKRIVNKFGTDYFTSSIGYMIAYALDKNYKFIKLYGIDMVTGTEYAQQKGGVEFWIGIGMARGVEFEISKGSTVMCPPTGVPYGQRIKVDLKMIDPYEILKGKK